MTVVWYASLRLRHSGGIVITWGRLCSLKFSPILFVVFSFLSKAFACSGKPRQTGLLNFLSIKGDCGFVLSAGPL
jgi:hypothetical protein